MKWIDINVEQPQADTEVIVCVDDDVFTSVYRVEGEYEFFDSDVDDQGCFENQVYHWMPLPEPPSND